MGTLASCPPGEVPGHQRRRTTECGQSSLLRKECYRESPRAPGARRDGEPGPPVATRATTARGFGCGALGACRRGAGGLGAWGHHFTTENPRSKRRRSTSPDMKIFVVLTKFLWGELRISLGLVDLSRIRNDGIFFSAGGPSWHSGAARHEKKIAVLTKLLCWKLRISLGLVDLSRIPNGAFFREVHPGSGTRKWLAKMTKTRQNY